MSGWGDRLRGSELLLGMWVASGSAYNTEICAASGIDALVIDAEHGPNDLLTVLAQLQAVAAHPVEALVRLPSGDPVLIKQLLDAGARNLVVPMVESAEQARSAVAATRYPPEGIRGVGGAFARASNWGRTPGYLQSAADTLTLTVQVESAAGLQVLGEIAAVDGVSAVFLGPADLAASMGHLGQPTHPEVVAAIEKAIGTITEAGTTACVNAFDVQLARRYAGAGARFVVVGADVSLLALGSVELVAKHRNPQED